MEGSVSNVDICNLAYMGQFEKVRQSVLSDKTLICKRDQVRIHALIRYIEVVYTFILFFYEDVHFRTAALPCTGLVPLAIPTSWSFCSTWEPK